ncbi:hypothetical protein C1646_775652 [Rhizophagus diaphanus]|nr:hypothetical protein C1646_775652 [Rhizophagus diaphanus] [Rhizophagus sp. MUCL 43196]
MDENQELRINFENGDGKERIIDKTKNSCIYQEREIKDKEKLDNLIKELVTEGSNVLEERIDEESENIIKLFRKMEQTEVAKKVNKKIWKGMPGYSYLTIGRKTRQAIKVYEMFSKIKGKRRIVKIKDFTWSDISRLNEKERQYNIIINEVKLVEKGDNNGN